MSEDADLNAEVAHTPFLWAFSPYVGVATNWWRSFPSLFFLTPGVTTVFGGAH